MAVGRKGKYEEWLTEEGLDKVREWAENGLTHKQICENIGITTTTFYEWIQRFPKFSDNLKNAQKVAINNVENALYKRAIGCTIVETKEEYEGETLIKRIVTKKEVAPDVGGCMAILKNRVPELWGDKVTNEITLSTETDDFSKSIKELIANVKKAEKPKKEAKEENEKNV